MRRSDQRRDAVFALYQRQVRGGDLDDILNGAKPFTRQLAHGTAERADDLDAEIARLAKGWELDRIAPLERNIMRVALLELLDPEAAPSDHPIPAEGAIDEAVETAKAYCSAQAPAFVNGILGAALRELRQNGAST
jgi:N utilization substance protein B